MKDPQKGTIPSNYRPITCLSTTWKLLSGIIAAKISRHMDPYMSRAQKGRGNNTRGAKHQLLVDRAIAQDWNITDVEDSYKYLGILQENGNHEEAARNHEGELETMRRQLVTMRRQLVTMRTQLETTRRQLVTMRTQLETMRRQLVTMRGQLVTMRRQLVTMMRQLVTMRGQLVTMRRQLVTMRGQLVTMRRQLVTMRGQLVTMRRQLGEETTRLQEYIKKMAPTDPLLSECLRQQKPSKEEEPEGLSWKDQPLHGMDHRQIEEVADIKKTYQELEKAGLEESTEELIMAAQELALSTRAIEARVHQTRPGQGLLE
ncbi:hypothetical protein D4764_15G0006290 [Takifugu flavidus]|uniref:Uncharacterized protein n=1 Tax=Takifugu flavidus TaxID=433684 RepID=A0A5C6P1P2_9TELE|nr:hypothetical protein D4764_15G0006290 [Takifugu flavidus]